jgi:hypothetical protein
MAAGFTASWVHGNAVVAEHLPPLADSSGLMDFNHFGWGTQITIRPNYSRWFHIAIPTPVIVEGTRMQLLRVFLGVRQIGGSVTGGFPRPGSGVPSSPQDLHLYDARNLVAKLSAKTDFNPTPNVSIDGNETFELRAPRTWVFGVGVSFQLSAPPNNSQINDDKAAPVFVIGSAGADFGPAPPT